LELLIPPEPRQGFSVSNSAKDNGVGFAKDSAEAVHLRSEFRMLRTHILPADS